MEKIVYLDKHGRLYLPEKVRRLFQANTLSMKVYNKSIIIEPADDDPIEALGKIGKGKLKGKSIQTLKKEAREEIEKNAIKKVRRL